MLKLFIWNQKKKKIILKTNSLFVCNIYVKKCMYVCLCTLCILIRMYTFIYTYMDMKINNMHTTVFIYLFNINCSFILLMTNCGQICLAKESAKFLGWFKHLIVISDEWLSFWSCVQILKWFIHFIGKHGLLYMIVGLSTIDCNVYENPGPRPNEEILRVPFLVVTIDLFKCAVNIKFV